MSYLNDIIRTILTGEAQLNNPTFTWNGKPYPCLPSVAEFSRKLEEGGFTVDKLLTMTVRLQNQDGSNVFPTSTLPTAQDVLTYQGLKYRIQSIKTHPTGAYIRITAMCTGKGI